MKWRHVKKWGSFQEIIMHRITFFMIWQHVTAKLLMLTRRKLHSLQFWSYTNLAYLARYRDLVVTEGIY